MLLVEIVLYALALWLGLYLLARDISDLRLRYTGLGLLAYAAALGIVILDRRRVGDIGDFTVLQVFLFLLPAVAWLRAMIALLPDEHPLQVRLAKAWRFGLLPVLLLYVLIFQPEPTLAIAYLLLITLIIAPLVLVLGLLWQARQSHAATPFAALVIVTLMFTLSTSLLAFPFEWLPAGLIIFLIGVDLLLLGLALTAFDALEKGERFRQEVARSFSMVTLGTAAMGGQVGAAIIITDDESSAMIVLLLGVISTMIALQILFDPLQALLDRLIFSGSPELIAQRDTLRQTAAMLPRHNAALQLAAMEEADFIRHTRRALRYLNNLPRLSTSPLVNLSAIDERLSARNASPDPLERAVELKDLLVQSINRLKPETDSDFGTSPEWRHFNALYFPYVAGLKPYGRQINPTQLDEPSHRAYDWFVREVPERTLYNWQAAAARLIALQLREQLSP